MPARPSSAMHTTRSAIPRSPTGSPRPSSPRRICAAVGSSQRRQRRSTGPRGSQISSQTSPSTPTACSPPTHRRSASTGPWTRSASPTPSPSSTATSVNPPAWTESSLGSLPKVRPFPSATSGSTILLPPSVMARTLPSSASASPTASPPTGALPSPISTTTSCAGPRQAHPRLRCRSVPGMMPKGTTDMRNPLAIPPAAAATPLTLAACGSSGTDSAEGGWPDESTMSLVPSIQGEDLAEALDPLTEYLSEGLGIEVNGVVANDYAATVEALGADQSQVIITDAGRSEEHTSELQSRGHLV